MDLTSGHATRRRPHGPTRRPPRSSLPAWAAAALLPLVAAPASAAPPPIPVGQITAGMTGYGLTEFGAGGIDTFSVRVLGVQNGARVQGSLIVVEVAGHDLERSSIAQGMSGSPVYLGGRFAGALAFGWEGALAPIGGVTPAEDMLALPTGPADAAAPSARHGGTADASALGWPRDPGFGLALEAALAGRADGARPAPAAPAASVVWGSPVAAAASQAASQAVLQAASPGAFAGPAAAAALAAITVPGGAWPDPVEVAAALLEPLAARGAGAAPAWLCLPAGQAVSPRAAAAGAGRSGAIPADQVPTLRPGSACAVTLVGGDAALGAIGTVTWVDGPRVLMMGHPFLQRGPVNLPLATADIITVLPSRRMSFKLGSPGPVVGAVHHDLRAGLAGRLGSRAPTIPVSVVVAGAVPGTYRFEVADDRQLTPALVFWSFYNALLARGDDGSRQRLDWRLETTWRLAGDSAARTLAQGGVADGPGSVGALATEVMTPLSLLLDNPFGEARLESVRFAVTPTPGRGSAAITALGAPRRVPAGTTSVPLTVELRDVDGNTRREQLDLTLPATLPPGVYRLAAASAAEFFAFEAQRAPERLQPTRLADLWDLLAAERSPARLVAALFASDRPLVVAGRELAGAPASVGRVVGAGRQPAEQAMASYAARRACDLPFALEGHAIRSLEILPAVPVAGDARRP